MRRAKAARTRLYLQLGREPTNAELATALDERVEKVVALRRAAKGSRALHANQYSGGSESRDDAADRAVQQAQFIKLAHRDAATNPIVRYALITSTHSFTLVCFSYPAATYSEPPSQRPPLTFPLFLFL